MSSTNPLIYLVQKMWKYAGVNRPKIIASGSFDELKSTSKEFQELWERYITTRDNIL